MGVGMSSGFASGTGACSAETVCLRIKRQNFVRLNIEQDLRLLDIFRLRRPRLLYNNRLCDILLLEIQLSNGSDNVLLLRNRFIGHRRFRDGDSTAGRVVGYGGIGLYWDQGLLLGRSRRRDFRRRSDTGRRLGSLGCFLVG